MVSESQAVEAARGAFRAGFTAGVLLVVVIAALVALLPGCGTFWMDGKVGMAFPSVTVPGVVSVEPVEAPGEGVPLAPEAVAEPAKPAEEPAK